MTGEEGWLPGQVPDGWKRHCFIPSGTAFPTFELLGTGDTICLP